MRETILTKSDFICPFFVQDGSTKKTPITTMPGVFRYSLDLLLKEMEQLIKKGLHGVCLFPLIASELKNKNASEALNDRGLYPRALRAVKENFPDLILMSDIALDPYSSDGHDGLVSPLGEILNDETLAFFCKMALLHAECGVDVIGPSDMMDGRVGAIRKALEAASHCNVSIMSYAAKYASALYGPFRDALESAPKAGDKKTYQMDPANRLEAVREAKLDIEEGADILMVKPAGMYLDIISDLQKISELPIAAYQGSGEYAMIAAAAASGAISRREAVLESLLACKRAGARVILSYFTPEVLDYLAHGEEE